MNALLFCASLALVLVGCSKPAEHAEAVEEKTVNLFKAGTGVFLPEEMKKRFGVELVEVTETNLPVVIEKPAEVYRAASDHSAGTAVVLVTEVEALPVKPGQPVELKSDEITAQGEVSGVDRAAEKAGGQIEVLISFPDPQEDLKVGQFVTARFVITKKEPGVVIPKSALLSAADGDSVYAVNGEHFTRTKVKTGAENETSIEIVDGLYAGDVVVAKAVGELWLVELQATKTGQACCAVPKK